MGTLYIVATPIGNLQDITLRALEILKGVDLILCEDTRVTKKLLSRYKIAKPLLSYHQHSEEEKMQEIFDLLCKGQNLALVTDAGTPGISDPGNELVAYLLAKEKEMGIDMDYSKLSRRITITPIPGPSAATALASVAGIPMDKFLFLGYPPHKKGRKKFFQEVIESKYPVIFYESPYRILRTMRDLEETSLQKIATARTYSVIVGRELTKKFETIYRGTISSIMLRLKEEQIRGEFSVAVWKG